MKIIRSSFFTVLFIFSFVFSLYAQDVIITSVSSTPVTCGAGADGTISVTVTGGIGLYTYLLVRAGIPVENAGPIASQNYTFTGHSKYGSYFIIVSDQDVGTADDFQIAAITGPDPISITTAFPTDITCNGANDGTITVSATGEGGNYVFDLTGPVSLTNETGFFSGLSQGDYTVQVSDKDGCPSTDVTPVLTVNNPSVISIAVDNVNHVLCFGNNTGSIAITPSGGVPSGTGSGYTYDWTGPGGFTSTTEDLPNIEAGDYFVTVFDGNMCSSNAGPITVTQPPDITVTLNGTTDVTCNGGNDGIAQITAGGGVGGYSYSWVGQVSGPASTDEDPVNLVTDTYDLTVTDGNGCSKIFTSFITINEPPPFSMVLDGTTNVSCFGGTNGTASITPGGGTPPYTFAWTGAISGYGSTDEDPISMPADDFSLTITDSRGCNQVYPSLVTITEPTPLIFVLDGTSDVSCFGGSDGSASISVSGGTIPYVFSWTGDGSGYSSGIEDPNDLVADTYDLTITDNNGCILAFNDLFVISGPADLAVTVDNITDVDCNGDATGVIDITPLDGTPVYSFSWTGPNGFTSNAEDIANLEAGDYSLTLSDANSCSKDFIAVATVAENSPITASFTIADVTCNGGSDGSIKPSVAGGMPIYSYSWTGPLGFTSSSMDISALEAGDYQLTVTDALGCVQVMPVQTLNEPPSITASATKVDIDCFKADNGSIDLTPSGGVPPYTFAWTGPGLFSASSEDISGLQPGAYSVTVTDANLCSTGFTDIATVSEPAEILVSSVKSDISCGGLIDGAIDITVMGGTLPYSFAWSGPLGFTSTSEDISFLEAGSYSLILTDGNGCIGNHPNIETIIEPSPINGMYVSHQDVLCNGDASGSIEINVSGGTAPFTFDWSNSLGFTQSTDEDPTGLQAETYSLTITDFNGCSVTYTNLVTILEPSALLSSLAGTNIACFGAGDGTIAVASSGGTPPYEYSIAGDIGPSYQPGTLFSALGPGLYTVWTRDANLCVISDTLTIIESPQIQILSETNSDNICFGGSSGQISIDAVTGGVMPYEYSIDGGTLFFPTSLFTNLPAGSYQTVVRDDNGCIVPGNLIVIGEPAALEVGSYSQDNISSCFGAPEGRIVIAGTGGTGIISYALDGSIPGPSGDFQNLQSGPHLVAMEDANGCTWDSSVFITTPTAMMVDNLTPIDVTGCNGDATGSVTVSGSGGTGTITYSLNSGPFLASGSFTNLLAGNYTLSLKDDNSCTLDTGFLITEPAVIAILSEAVTDITCSGASDGIIEITATGGTAPLTFMVTPGLFTNATGMFTGLAADTYTVSVDDAAGCGPVDSSPLSITEPPPLIIDSLREGIISCSGANDGTISIYASGGAPPYEYSINNQANWSSDSLFTRLAPATYEVYIRDANLCVIYRGSYVMVDPPMVTATITTTDITTCSGDTTGMIKAIGNGGRGTLEYSIDSLNFLITGTFINLSGGSYTIYVRDSVGCSITEPVFIAEPDSIKATITKTEAILGNLGSIIISGTTGGTPPYQYTIKGDTGTYTGDTAYFNLEAATYPVIIMDTNGCSYQEIVEILDVLPLDVLVNQTEVSCLGADDGTIEFIPQNAEGQVVYSIDSGMNFVSSALFENLPGNAIYYLFARDEANKEYTGSVTITEPTKLRVTRNSSPAECNAFSETGSMDITVSGGTPPYTFLWDDGSTRGNRNNVVAGIHTVVTTDSANCSRTDYVLVSSLVTVDAYAGKDTTICDGDSIQLIGLGGNILAWDPSPFITDTSIANQVTLEITEPTTFILTIREDTSPYGCYNIDSMDVMLYPPLEINATEDTSIISGASIQLHANGGFLSEYRWEPATGLDNSKSAEPIATPLESIRYYVYETNEYGCEGIDSVYIEVAEDLLIYNVFSPNGDGVNDYFEIENAERFPEMLVEVYSRWGDQFFSTVGYDDGSRWDGTARGKDAPVGTYFYIIIPYSGAKPITGNVTIIR